MQRRNPADPLAWMDYALNDLEMASQRRPRIMLESYCFHAQQAVEKSIKGVLVARGIPFPKTHVIEHLIDLLPADVPRPEELILSSSLTEYATISRYPGMEEPATEADYNQALRLAEAVVAWAEGMIAPPKPETENGQ